MPRKNPVPETERAICRRLHQARRQRRLSRVALGEAIGVPTTRLQNYDYERVPVPYDVGRAVCELCNVNQRWLATGELPASPFVYLGEELDREPPKGSLFSEVFATTLRGPVEDWLHTAAAAMSGDVAEVGEEASLVLGRDARKFPEALDKLLELAVIGMLHSVPDTLKTKYARHIVSASKEFAKLHEGEIARWWDEFDAEFAASQKPGAKGKVDTFLNLEHDARVNLTWADLRKRLVRATAPAGKKAALAAALDVYQARLTGWLGGEHEPGVEVAFRMLAWVTAEEAKNQKSPGGVLAPPERKAQKRTKTDEGNKSQPGRCQR